MYDFNLNYYYYAMAHVKTIVVYSYLHYIYYSKNI